jgi:hypothetical protein
MLNMIAALVGGHRSARARLDVRPWGALGICLLLCVGHGTSLAQPAADKAAADALFNEGKKLIGQGDDAAACEKFEASLAKLTQLGTRIALASCYEKLGRTASAWGAFRAAAAAASKANDRRQQFCEDHALALEAALSMIAIKIDAANLVDGLDVKRDGSPVMPAELGMPVPVDPGEHTVAASAPGRVAWSTTVSIPATPGTVEVHVPALDQIPDPAPDPRPRRRALAYYVGGGGVAALSASLILGAVARSRWSDAQSHCHDRLCDQAGVDLAHGAQSAGNVSTAAFVVGASAAVAGAILWFTASPARAENAPARGPSALHLVPEVGAAQVGLAILGGF